jgi:hypothetical protein
MSEGQSLWHGGRPIFGFPSFRSYREALANVRGKSTAKRQHKTKPKTPDAAFKPEAIAEGIYGVFCELLGAFC